MKIYKCYFDKNDTPFRDEFHNTKDGLYGVFLRQPYTKFLKHEVVKIKLFGIFTIYKKEELK